MAGLARKANKKRTKKQFQEMAAARWKKWRESRPVGEYGNWG